MFRLEYGKSYLWAFPVHLVLFVGGVALCAALGHINWGALMLPPFFAVMFVWQLRSGVALDSWWRASYRAGSWQYRALLAWNTVVLALSLAISYFAITLLP